MRLNPSCKLCGPVYFDRLLRLEFISASNTYKVQLLLLSFWQACFVVFHHEAPFIFRLVIAAPAAQWYEVNRGTEKYLEQRLCLG